MRASARRCRPDWHTCLAGVIAWLFVATSLASFAHRAQVEHEICAAHGESFHVDGRQRIADATSPGSRSSTDVPTSASLRGGATDHEHGRDHEHCELGQLRPGTCERLMGAEAAGLSEPILAIDERAPVESQPAIALDHRSAPKTSPPQLG